MPLVSQKERHNRALELPEIISGGLVLLVTLWLLCFQKISQETAAEEFFRTQAFFRVLVSLVGTHAAMVVAHAVHELWLRRSLGRMLWLQLAVVLAAAVLFGAVLYNPLTGACLFWPLVLAVLGISSFSLVRMGMYMRARRQSPVRGRAGSWSPSVTFFSYMLVFVVVSTLLLLTPGATHHPISFTQALFTCASASSITGLTCVNVAETFTPLGKSILLIDIQVGAVGVMTFTYFVLMMLGRRLAVRDSMNMSGVLDQQGVNVVPALLKAVFGVTLTAELAGAACLYFLWRGEPGIPQDHLWAYALFHSVSAFCNAGITLFPAGMSHAGVAGNYAAQGVMMALIIAGTLGFGVYLEGIQRVRARLAGKKPSKRWSTHSWLVMRVTLIVMLAGTVAYALLGAFEPSVHTTGVAHNTWEAAWNAVSRSAGFNLTDIDAYGPVYKAFMCLMMFVGGNPAGTGGGVFAPVVCLCVLEVWRVLRGAQDVEIHQRRISRVTIERAMATVVLSIIWIVFTTMLLLLLEPEIAASDKGFLKALFLEVSAYTTTGYDLDMATHLSPLSRLLITANMLFGRVGMFTFMLIFIKQRDPAPMRFPETRLPLS